MKTLTLCILAFSMAACSGCDDEPSSRADYLEVRAVSIAPNEQVPGYYIFDAIVRHHGRNGWQGVAQEVRINGELVAIEFFACGSGRWHDDQHRGGKGETRTMSCWPADVEGVALVNGYGMLWRSPTIAFNEFHTAPIGGSITRQGEVTEWSIEANAAGVTVTIGGKAAFYAAPK